MHGEKLESRHIAARWQPVKHSPRAWCRGLFMLVCGWGFLAACSHWNTKELFFRQALWHEHLHLRHFCQLENHVYSWMQPFNTCSFWNFPPQHHSLPAPFLLPFAKLEQAYTARKDGWCITQEKAGGKARPIPKCLFPASLKSHESAFSSTQTINPLLLLKSLYVRGSPQWLEEGKHCAPFQKG